MCYCCSTNNFPFQPLKENFTIEEENHFNSKLDKHKPSAVRHLILVRHGQYDTNGKSDEEKILTDTGRIQAKFTGDRLKDLKIPIDSVFISTMSRAQETGKIILKSLPELENLNIENDPMLEEGAPIAPEPPIGHWKPEPSVIFYLELTPNRIQFLIFPILAVFSRRRQN